MEKRYFIKVGDCFVEFLWHGVKMRSGYKKATPHLTKENAKVKELKEILEISRL